MDVSLAQFVAQVVSNPILAVTVLLTLGVIFVNGWTDAPNAIATAVTTRSINIRPAIIMSAVFNFLGVLLMTMINSSVASTISNMVDFGTDTQMALVALCAALFSIVVYSVGASIFGIPTSESHSLIAGLTGAALAVQGGLDGVNGQEWIKVIYGLVLSLALGFALGWGICKALTIICANMDRRRTNKAFKYAQIFGAAAMSFMHGAQDGQKFIGVLLLGVAFCNGQPDLVNAAIPIWLMMLCSITMGVGTSVGGEKIIKSVGMDMVKLETSRASRPTSPVRCASCFRPSRAFPFPRRIPRRAHHGCRRGQAPVRHQLLGGEGHDAYMGVYVPRLRPHQLRDGEGLHDGVLAVVDGCTPPSAQLGCSV